MMIAGGVPYPARGVRVDTVEIDGPAGIGVALVESPIDARALHVYEAGALGFWSIGGFVRSDDLRVDGTRRAPLPGAPDVIRAYGVMLQGTARWQAFAENAYDLRASRVAGGGGDDVGLVVAHAPASFFGGRLSFAEDGVTGFTTEAALLGPAELLVDGRLWTLVFEGITPVAGRPSAQPLPDPAEFGVVPPCVPLPRGGQTAPTTTATGSSTTSPRSPPTNCASSSRPADRWATRHSWCAVRPWGWPGRPPTAAPCSGR
jgi:hypothetical protein